MDGTPFGPYRLLELLGEGGMGRVYRAYDTNTDRIVALKVLPQQIAHDPVFRERFRRESLAAARLNEPHVIPIHAHGEIDGSLYLDMRLVEGTDLGKVLAREGRLESARALAYLEQIASALDAAHRSGLVHRDVKPSNILLTDSGFAYLIDFGIARGTEDSGLTTMGSAIGTFAYMAPERLAQGVSGPGSDVYSLACVLYECLTGSKPFAGDSVERQIAGHLTQPPPRPSAAGSVPPALDEVIARGMAKNPADRHPSAGAFIAAARAASRGLPPAGDGYPGPAPTRIDSTPFPLPQRRRPVLVWVAAAVIAPLLIGGILLGRHVVRDNSSTGQSPAGTSIARSTSSSANTLGLDELDNKAVQKGVQKVLKDSYGIKDAQNISCPSGQKVVVGHTFDCTLKIGGADKKVTVKITKADGTYEVGRPV
ncbi:protein kinase [Nocardia sp. NPDC051030]|uniref:protein kinase domain-containing protein n=1 Tax=Nocardia sp. NPDC051030 TaxID=3155162 RepID=UPI0034223C23